MSQRAERKKARKNLAGLARKYTEEAVETLVKIMRNSKSDNARLSAASELLDRGYGKAPAFIESEVSVVTHDELIERGELVAAGSDAGVQAETCH